MKKAYLSPYLNMPGTCEDAMIFYQTIFGGKLEMSKYGDSGMKTSDAWKKKIIHATLQNDTLSFMACDSPEENQPIIGTNIHMSIAGTDEPSLTQMFKKLSEGGKITMPLAKQFWGDTFGMVTDKFGINWMFNISEEKSA